MKKTISTILLMALVLSLSASCGGNEPVQTETTAADTTTEPVKRDNLPEKDYGGDEFGILARTEWNYEFDVEQDGDIMNDAVFARNRTVEERFNVDLKVTLVDGVWDKRANFLNHLTNSILADDGAYDLVAGYQAYILTPIMEGYFLNILDMDHIDPGEKWWSQKCHESIIVNNQLYMLAGDVSISLWENIYVMLFNQKLANEYQIEDVYALVNNGTWTIDKLYEISSAVSSDLNGDSKFDEEDLFGFASSGDNHVRVWYAPCDLHMTTRGEDGFMEMSYNTERTQNALDKLVKLYSAQSSFKGFNSFNSPSAPWEDANMFSENRILFTPGYLKTASKLRGMESDFGIVPLPKYDELQKDYLTTVADSASVMCFPKTIRDPEQSAIITEALCIESHYEVIPKYYDLVLKAKSARDPESEAMIDLIRDSVTYDFGAIYTVPMSGTIRLLGGLIVEGKTDFASAYAKQETIFENNLERINQAYGKNAEYSVSSKKTKIIRSLSGLNNSAYTEYVGNKINNARLKIVLKAIDSHTSPYVANIKILKGESSDI